MKNPFRKCPEGGRHDWEYIERISRNTLRVQLRYDLMRKKPPLMVNHEPPNLYRRVCIRCGRIEDTIEPAVVRLRAAMKLEKERRDKAWRFSKLQGRDQ